MEKTDLERQIDLNPEEAVETPESKSIETEEIDTASETDILTGFKLYITLFSVTLVGFLIMLDSSIVVTVRRDTSFKFSNMLTD